MFQRSEPKPQRLTALAERLLKAGIAPRHVRRTVEELEDHLDDLIAAQKERGYDEPDAFIRARALLGDDAELTEAMIANSRLRSLPARAPWLVFGVLPPLLVVAVLLLTGFGLAALAIPLHGPHLPLPPWCAPLAKAVCAAANYGIGPLAALGMGVLAWRQRLSGFWPLIGAGLSAVFGIVTTLDVVMPLGLQKGQMSVSLGVAFPALFYSPRFVATLSLAAITAAVWTARRRLA